MADNLPNVKLPSDEWIDLYDETGIDVGTQLEVQNVGSASVQLTALATTPPAQHDAFNIAENREVAWRNEWGDAGAWARSRNEDGALSVKAVN